MLLGRCLSCLPLLSVTLMYRGQMVRWIKMTLGVEVGLGPSHIVEVAYGILISIKIGDLE